MTRLILVTFITATSLGISVFCRSAEAISPRNPYRTFNLGGVNYGSMRWERTHRQGRSSWPKNKSARRPQIRGDKTMMIGGISSGVFLQRSESSNRMNQSDVTIKSSR
ncbi:MAG TPA: hypothetical protein DEB70_12915 [Planctomycetaceae bacterium]|nr:hypothetical protein [Planctomycetaceae bacterium]